MISAQLSKYKQPQISHHTSSHKPSAIVRAPLLQQALVSSHFSQNPSPYHPPPSYSCQQSPKSKIGLLNEKLLRETQMYNQRRGKSLNGSHARHVRSKQRSRERYIEPWNPVDPIIERFVDMEEKIRRSNAVVKQKLASVSKRSHKQSMKLSLPPKSPFAVSEYLQSSAARSNGEKDGHKSTAHSNTKRGVEQIVFVTDQSDNQVGADSEDQYKSTKQLFSNKEESKFSTNYQSKGPKQLQLNSNGFKAQMGRVGSGFRTPSFNEEEQPILSPLQVGQELNGVPPSPALAPPAIPISKVKDHYPPKTHKSRNNNPIYISVFLLTLIGAFLLYEIIK